MMRTYLLFLHTQFLILKFKEKNTTVLFQENKTWFFILYRKGRNSVEVTV
jgi:hypothetical protein